MSHLKELDLGVSKFIGTYSDAVEAKGGLKWLFTSGTPGVMPGGTLPPALMLTVVKHVVKPEFLVELAVIAAVPVA